jgi:hypothetical protein
MFAVISTLIKAAGFPACQHNPVERVLVSQQGKMQEAIPPSLQEAIPPSLQEPIPPSLPTNAS